MARERYDDMDMDSVTGDMWPIVPHQYRLAADFIGLQTPQNGMSQLDDMNSVEVLRNMYEYSRSGLGPNLLDWRKPARPKSASYMRPKCRMTPDGAGGAPLQQPAIAASLNRQSPPKTERWRESGLTRWPKEAEKKVHPTDPSDGDPLRRGEPEQPGWTGELWIRSLRRPGLEIQDPAYHDVAQRGMRELHEQWKDTAPRRPHSARAGSGRPHSARAGSGNGPSTGHPLTNQKVPYGGSTAIGAMATPRRHNEKAWVERPVAVGKMALAHHGGQRYAFNQECRYLEWKDYEQNINPSRT